MTNVFPSYRQYFPIRRNLFGITSPKWWPSVFTATPVSIHSIQMFHSDKRVSFGENIVMIKECISLFLLDINGAKNGHDHEGHA